MTIREGHLAGERGLLRAVLRLTSVENRMSDAPAVTRSVGNRPQALGVVSKVYAEELDDPT